MTGEDEGGQLQVLHAALDRGLQDDDIRRVAPIIIPRDYLKFGNWPGPASFPRHPDLAIAWVLMLPDDAMVYVTFERQEAWERDGIDWKRRAHDNLNEHTIDLWTHDKRDDAGRVVWVAMMHSDALGSSRLLLADRLRDELGGDYRVALPDRSCGIAVPLSAGEGALAEAAHLAEQMHAGATTPMLPALLEPDALLLE